MNYLVKALMHRILSSLPGGGIFNTSIKKKLHLLPRPDADFDGKIRSAIWHLRQFQRNVPKTQLSDAHFFEFGAGEDIILPIIYAFFGVHKQTIVDIQSIADIDLINNSIERLCSQRAQIQSLIDIPYRPMSIIITDIQELADQLGINYIAPMDARATGLPDAQVDFISNTTTLEHIPEDVIPDIIKECKRILNFNGIMSCIIDLQDHYSYSDPRISSYNFLRFSERTWNWLNPSLHYQNRLRASDYYRMFDDARFSCIVEENINASEADLEILKRFSFPTKFSKYKLEDVGVRVMNVVMR